MKFSKRTTRNSVERNIAENYVKLAHTKEHNFTNEFSRYYNANWSDEDYLQYFEQITDDLIDESDVTFVQIKKMKIYWSEEERRMLVLGINDDTVIFSYHNVEKRLGEWILKTAILDGRLYDHFDFHMLLQDSTHEIFPTSLTKERFFADAKKMRIKDNKVELITNNLANSVMFGI